MKHFAVTYTLDFPSNVHLLRKIINHHILWLWLVWNVYAIGVANDMSRQHWRSSFQSLNESLIWMFDYLFNNEKNLKKWLSSSIPSSRLIEITQQLPYSIHFLSSHMKTKYCYFLIIPPASHQIMFSEMTS